eukprot:scaffold53436_cov28-Prasinocladus_malaysianus.AAC.1
MPVTVATNIEENWSVEQLQFKKDLVVAILETKTISPATSKGKPASAFCDISWAPDHDMHGYSALKAVKGGASKTWLNQSGAVKNPVALKQALREVSGNGVNGNGPPQAPRPTPMTATNVTQNAKRQGKQSRIVPPVASCYPTRSPLAKNFHAGMGRYDKLSEDKKKLAL